MAGHSKWHQIKHKKGANDAKRGKIFTKHARLIMIAAKSGADPEQNPTLRAAIEYAKTDNVPNENIERAIKKGAGDAEESQLHECLYEGYGPGGVAILILVVTDNKNRSFANVRTIMSKNGGTMGEAGSVNYMFNKMGVFYVQTPTNKSDFELQLIEFGAEEINEMDEETFEIRVAVDNFWNFKSQLNSNNTIIHEAKLTFVPNIEISLNETAQSDKLELLINKLEEDDDVIEVITNMKEE